MGGGVHTLSVTVDVGSLSKTADSFRMKIVAIENSLKTLDGLMEETREKIDLLEETVKIDPGIPVVKAMGTIYNKTQIVAPHKEMILAEDMQKVRIAEAKEDPSSNKYQIKISNLR